MTHKFTVGPWTKSPYGENLKDGVGGRWHINEPHVDVHPVWDGGIHKGRPDGVIISAEEAAANAKLITTAPELLEALENIEVNLTGRDCFPDRIADSLRCAREAIAKATTK